ncbi:MAG: bifunctional nuclease family protein [Acidimicrobiales bacterium]
MKPVDVLGLNLETGSGAPLVVLREQDAPHRVLPIFIGGREAVAIALALSGQSPPRPLTHDLLAALIDGLDARVDHVEVTEVRDGTFLAELAVAGPRGGVNLDSRPSDAIALALRVDAPVYASEAVLDEAGALVPIETDDETINEDVDRFRAFLDDVEPSDFDQRQGPDQPPDQADT